MRAFVSLVAALCMVGFTMPAQAIGMQFCDDIKDDQARMACLQDHITHLEESHRGVGRTRRHARDCAAEDARGRCELQIEVGGARQVPRSRWRQERRAGARLLRGSRFLVGDERSADQEAGKGRCARSGRGKPASSAGSTPPPTSADASKPGGKGFNPCKDFDQAACTAKADICVWKTEKNKCGKKG